MKTAQYLTILIILIALSGCASLATDGGLLRQAKLRGLIEADTVRITKVQAVPIDTALVRPSYTYSVPNITGTRSTPRGGAVTISPQRVTVYVAPDTLRITDTLHVPMQVDVPRLVVHASTGEKIRAAGKALALGLLLGATVVLWFASRQR